MPANAPVIHKLPLAPDQYYQKAYAKKYIFLHHTAGGSAASSVGGWAANPEHIATPYLIDRNGDIFETYDPKYWAYSLGVKGNSDIEKAAIPIEICCYGSLAVAKKDETPKPGKPIRYKKGDIITYTGKVIAHDKIVTLPSFRPEVNPFNENNKYVDHKDVSYTATLWEAYTPQQIAALAQLLPYLIDKFKITLQPDRKNFWEYKNPATLPPGIYSHTTVRKDKIDIFPQKKLVDLVYGL